MRIVFILVALFSTILCTGQIVEASSIEKNWSKELYQKKLNSYIKLAINDVRQYGQYKVELNKLMTIVSENLGNRGFNFIDDINDTLKKVIPVNIILNVDYLNYTESTSKNLFMKGIIDIILEKGDFLNENKTLKVADDILIGDFSLKSIFNPKNGSSKNRYETILMSKLADEIISEVSVALNNNAPKLYEVVSFGKAAILKSDLQKAKNDAIANAILNASSNAFGKKIQSETTMIDMGNVTEVIKESINCTVLEYKLLDGFEKVSKDKYVCVLVKSILKL